MFSTRTRIQNDTVALGLDAVTGQLLELINLKTGENLIKNHLFGRPQPFCLTAGWGEDTVELTCADVPAAATDPSLAAQIIEFRQDGCVGLRVHYDRLWAGGQAADVSVTYTVWLPRQGGDSRWCIHMENHSSLTITRVAFPCVNGVYLGESWADDCLVYPYNAGARWENPVEYLARDVRRVDWKWQDYRYAYTVDSFPHTQADDGLCAVEHRYSGPLSMGWMDLYDGDGGLYYAVHDPSADIFCLRVETYGAARPGLCLSAVHDTDMGPGATYDSPPCVVALHGGDWHEGADIYRAFRESCAQCAAAPLPDWFLHSPGLVAHYDFKYQGGGIIHRFRDLPALYDQAREMGFAHLLLSGWHRDGFDNGFPLYQPDPDLGTEAELKEQVARIRADGGHVGFYMNSRLANRKYEHLKTFVQQNEARGKDGTPTTERYGSGELSFAGMCPCQPAWRDWMADAVSYSTHVLGLDGVYLDQLAMAPPCLCYSHGHPFNAWNRGYEDMLAQIHAGHEGVPFALLYEGVSDAHGHWAAGQLISTFFYHHAGAFPQMYKYTFPHQILVDMLYPRLFQAMRPAHVALAAPQIMARAFVTGSYYWVYDLEQDNTFRLDPVMGESLRACVALRRTWLERFGHGTFRDTVGLGPVPGGLWAGRYDVDGGVLVAVANPGRRCGETLQVDLPEGRGAPCATVFTGQGEGAAPLFGAGSRVRVAVPDALFSLIHIKA